MLIANLVGNLAVLTLVQSFSVHYLVGALPTKRVIRAMRSNLGFLAAAVLPNLYFGTRKIIINEVLLSKFQTHQFFPCLAKVDLI